MFCRFGSFDDSRPVEATAIAYEVWTRPVRGLICSIKASV